MKKLDVVHFAQQWNTHVDDIPNEIIEDIDFLDASYRAVTKEELEEYINYFIGEITKPTAVRTVEENLKIFEKGWAENKEIVSSSGCTMDSFVPKYCKQTPYHRGPCGEIMHVTETDFVSKIQALYIKYIALSYFKDYSTVHEFGSGSGFNLFNIAKSSVGKKWIGYEWTQSGVDLANMIGLEEGFDVSGIKFDMFNPDYSINLEGDAVLTCGSIEQLNEKYQDFIDFILIKKPSIVVHLEPEILDSKDITVYQNLSNLYIKMRQYSKHLSKHLKNLEEQNRLKILFDAYVPWMGNRYDIKCTIWAPINV